jgi:hypothetical protein
VVNGPAAFGGSQSLTFVMIKDGSDWLIEELWYSGGGSNIVQ